MAISSHIQNLEERHAALEGQIQNEFLRPLPDFVKVTQLKKQKLRIKEQLAKLGQNPAAA